jgi:signal transduction histidine kinase
MEMVQVLISVSGSPVKLHGGSLEARSAGAGKGSGFIVRLPLAKSD